MVNQLTRLSRHHQTINLTKIVRSRVRVHLAFRRAQPTNRYTTTSCEVRHQEAAHGSRGTKTKKVPNPSWNAPIRLKQLTRSCTRYKKFVNKKTKLSVNKLDQLPKRLKASFVMTTHPMNNNHLMVRTATIIVGKGTLRFWQLPNRGNWVVCGWRIRAMSAGLAGLLAGYFTGAGGVCVRYMIG